VLQTYVPCIWGIKGSAYIWINGVLRCQVIDLIKYVFAEV